MKLRAPHIAGISILAIGVIAIIVIQLLGLGKSDGESPLGTITVTGVVGSEKAAFFNDERVRKIFAENGFEVDVTTSGSWRMADLDGLNTNDFAFPASEVAAEHIRNKVSGVIGVHRPFFSPMAIATFAPIMQLLETKQVASQENGVWHIDMAKYLELVAADTRWNDLSAPGVSYDSSRSVMITSTDIRSSNSASQYLALAAYAANGSSVITTQAQAEALQPSLAALFLGQGYSGSSSAGPFEDYLSQGMSAVPMVMIYEGQFLEEQIKETSRIRDTMVLAYPDPTIFSKHTAVTFSEDGEKVMDLLESDPELAELLAEHGFRPTGDNGGAFQDLLEQKDLTQEYIDTDTLVDLASEPSYEVMDYLLTGIASQYDIATGGSGTVAPDPTPTEGSP